MNRPRPGEIARLAVALLFFAAAPTAGDIGSCGQPPDDLDAAKFFNVKGQIDCARCGECGLNTTACRNACALLVPAEFEPDCYPLVHDGEVCLNALLVASCAEYARYMAEAGSSDGSGGAGGDAGAAWTGGGGGAGTGGIGAAGAGVPGPTECNFCPPRQD
jgi:hypothetical protein